LKKLEDEVNVFFLRDSEMILEWIRKWSLWLNWL